MTEQNYELHLDIDLDTLTSGWVPTTDDAELDLTELFK